MPNKSPAITALSIAGSDPSGGAGIQADLKVFAAHFVYGMAVPTALTVQNTCGVQAVHPVPTQFVRDQICALQDDIRIDAVKIGMLGDAEMVQNVAQRMRECGAPLVVDPVMVSKNGRALLAPEAVATFKADLLPLCTLLTPNLPEAACLLDLPEATSRKEMEEQGQAILALGAKAVLMKGGHFDGALCPDCLVSTEGAEWFETERIETKNSHGTGCTLSSAIAANLAKGLTISDAVKAAKTYLTGALRNADAMQIGQGQGPLDHGWMG